MMTDKFSGEPAMISYSHYFNLVLAELKSIVTKHSNALELSTTVWYQQCKMQSVTRWNNLPQLNYLWKGLLWTWTYWAGPPAPLPKMARGKILASKGFSMLFSEGLLSRQYEKVRSPPKPANANCPPL